MSGTPDESGPDNEAETIMATDTKDRWGVAAAAPSLVDELEPRARARWWGEQVRADGQVLASIAQDDMPWAAAEEASDLLADAHAAVVAVVVWLRERGESWATIADGLREPVSTVHERFHDRLGID